MTNTALRKEAKRIGSKQGLLSVGLGLLIAQLIMTGLMWPDKGFGNAFFWFASIDYKFNIVVGAIIMLLSGHLYGQLAGIQIVLKKRNFVIVGFVCGMAVLLTTATLCGWTGFFQEGVDNIGTEDNPFNDYIFKPLFWVTIFGTIPALLVGAWFGWRVKSNGKSVLDMPG